MSLLKKIYKKIFSLTLFTLLLFIIVFHIARAGTPQIVFPWGNAYEYFTTNSTVMPDACNPAMGGSPRAVYEGFATYGLYTGAYDAGPCQNTPSPSQLARLITANTNMTTACGSGLCGLVTWGHSKQQYKDTAGATTDSSGHARAENSNLGSFSCLMGFGSGGSGTCVTSSALPNLNSNFRFWPCAVGLKESNMWIDDTHNANNAQGLYTDCFSSIISPDGGTKAEVQAVWGLHISLINSRIAVSGTANVASGGLSVTFTSGGLTNQGQGSCSASGSNWFGSPITIDGEISRISECSSTTTITLAYPNQTCISGCTGVPWSIASYNDMLNGQPDNGQSAASYEALLSAWGIRYYKSSQWPNVKIHYFSSEYDNHTVGFITQGLIFSPQDDFENAWSDQMLVDSQVNEMGTQATGLTLTRGGTGNKTVTVTSASNLPSIVIPSSAMFPHGKTLSYTTGMYVHVLSASDPTYDTTCTPAQCPGAIITSVSSSSFTYQLSSAPTSASVSDGYATVVPDPTGIESLECGNNNCASQNGTAPVLAWGPYEYLPVAPNIRVDGWTTVPPDSGPSGSGYNVATDLIHGSFIATGCDGTRTITNSAYTINTVPAWSTFPGNPWLTCPHTNGFMQALGTIDMNFFTNCNMQNGCTPPWGGPVLTTTLNAGGSGYAIGDTFTINRGAATTGLAVGKVTGVSSGAVTSYQITFTGDSYSTSTATATTHTSGSGVGLKVNVTGVGTYGYGPTGQWTSWICASGHQTPGCQ